MKFAETGGDPDITFLYEVGEGVAHHSYGLNVARLAHVPTEVIDVAAVKSKKLEDKVRVARIHETGRAAATMLQDRGPGFDVDALAAAVDEL